MKRAWKNNKRAYLAVDRPFIDVRRCRADTSPPYRATPRRRVGGDNAGPTQLAPSNDRFIARNLHSGQDRQNNETLNVSLPCEVINATEAGNELIDNDEHSRSLFCRSGHSAIPSELNNSSINVCGLRSKQQYEDVFGTGKFCLYCGRIRN